MLAHGAILEVQEICSTDQAIAPMSFKDYQPRRGSKIVNFKWVKLLRIQAKYIL